jgi:hypothetical protein
MFRRYCWFLFLASVTLQAQPRLEIRRSGAADFEVIWPADDSAFVLEQSSALSATSIWQPAGTQPVSVGTNLVVSLKVGPTAQFFRLTLAELSGIEITSPYDGEQNVAVTRETIVRFTTALELGTILDSTSFYATSAGKRILSRVELSADRRQATLFYLEPLPGSAQVDVFLIPDDLLDEQQRPLDGASFPPDNNILSFTTLSLSPVSNTAVVGTVYASELDPLTHTNRPIAGVTVTVDGMEQTLRAVTDAQGHFTLSPVPPGTFFVHIDGRTVTDNARGIHYPDKSYYPFVGKAWNAIAGVTNNPAGGSGLIYLPLIVAGTLQPVSQSAPTTISFPPSILATNPAFTGVNITVPANSLFSDNGSRGGKVGIAPVPSDRLPGPLPPGLEMPIVITVQTDGPLNFDEPAAVCFPNVVDPILGTPLPAGSKQALMSFNHDKGAWEAVGTMTVSADGKYVCSDPGSGIKQPGWHGVAPEPDGPPPPPCDGPQIASLTSGTVHAFETVEECRASCDRKQREAEDKADRDFAFYLFACAKGRGGVCPPTNQLWLGEVRELDYKDARTLGNLCRAACVPKMPPPPPPPKPPKAPRKPKTCRPPQKPNRSASAKLRVVTDPSSEIVRQVLAIATEIASVMEPYLRNEALPPAAQAQIDSLVAKANSLAGGDASEFLQNYESSRETEQAAAGTLDEPDGNAPDYPVLYAAMILRPSGPMIIRGQTEPFGQYQLFVPRDGRLLSVRFYDPFTKSSAIVYPRWRPDAPWRLPSFELAPVTPDATDTDADGLADAIELIYGTDPRNADSDGDGLADGAEVEQLTNPLDGRPMQTGIIATTKTPAAALDLAVSNDRLVVAQGPAGVGLFSPYNGNSPVLLAQIPLTGAAQRVASDGETAVAVGDGWLHVISLPDAQVLYQLRLNDALSVAISSELIFVGSGSGTLSSIELPTGRILATVSLPGPVRDLAVLGSYVYAATETSICTLTLNSSPVLVSTVPNPRTLPAGSRLFAGGRFLYAVHPSGYTVFDLTDPSRPKLLQEGATPQFGWRQIVPNGSGSAVAVVGPNSFDEPARDIYLYDLHDPAGPISFVTSFPTPGSASAVTLWNGLAYAADGASGLQVINYVPFDTSKVAPNVALQLGFDPNNVESSRFVWLAANATDDVQVRNVELYVNDKLILNDASYPFEFRFNLPVMPPGTPVRIRAKAYDTGGNVGSSEEIAVPVLADKTAPFVVLTTPIGGGRTVQSVSATFSEPMDPTSLTAASFQLFTEGNVAVPGTIQFDSSGKTATLSFSALPPGTYRAVLTASVRDIAGNPLASDYAWTFAVENAAFWRVLRDGQWNNPSNWADRNVPARGEKVIVNVPVSISLPNGTLVSGNVKGVSGSKLVVEQSATFDRVQLDIDLLMPLHSKILVTNNLTVNSAVTMAGGLNLNQLNFSGSQTLDGSGVIFMTDPNFNTTQIQPVSGTLTIGPNITIRGSGRVGAPNLPLVNNGKILAEFGGYSRISVVGSTVDNNGALIATNSILAPQNVQNHGAIELWNSTLLVSGTNTPSQFGSLTGSNGVVTISGTLDNRGNDLLIRKSVRWELTQGLLLGGTISGADGGEFTIIASDGTVDNVTVQGTLRATSGAHIAVLNGLTLNGQLIIDGNLNITRLSFQGTQTLAGSGQVFFTDPFRPGNTVLEPRGGTLTIGSQITIRGGNATVGNKTDPLINNGTIIADGRDSHLSIYGNPFTNNGQFQQTNGGVITINQ